MKIVDLACFVWHLGWWPVSVPACVHDCTTKGRQPIIVSFIVHSTVVLEARRQFPPIMPTTAHSHWKFSDVRPVAVMPDWSSAACGRRGDVRLCSARWRHRVWPRCARRTRVAVHQWLRNQLALVTSLLIAWFIISAVFVLQWAVIG